MGKRRWLAAGSSLLAAVIGLLGAATAASASTASPVVSYAINPDGSLTLIGSTPIRGGGADIDFRLSPDGKTLSVDGSGNHILSVFAVHGGTLTELPSSPAPLPAGGAPAGIVNL